MQKLQKIFINSHFSIPKTLDVSKREMKFSKFDFNES